MGGFENFVLGVIMMCTLTVIMLHILYLKDRFAAEQREKLISWIKVAVQAAEQTFEGAGLGYEKLEYVKNWLYENHTSVYDYFTQEDVDAIIEATVYETTK